MATALGQELEMRIASSATRNFAIVLVVVACAAGTASATDLAQPITLAATPRLARSQFSETVLVAALLPNGMPVRFVVNRPSDITLAGAFPGNGLSRRVVDSQWI